MAIGYALDWDMQSAQALDGGKKVKLAPGVYPFVVVSFTKGRYEGGTKVGACPVAEITVEVSGVEDETGNPATTTLTDNLKLWASEFHMGLIGSFFRSIGAPTGPDGKTVTDWSQPLVGRSGFVEIDLHDFVRDGQTNQANGIVRWVAPEQAALVAGPSHAAAAPTAQPAAPQPQAYQPTPAYQPALMDYQPPAPAPQPIPAPGQYPAAGARGF